MKPNFISKRIYNILIPAVFLILLLSGCSEAKNEPADDPYIFIPPTDSAVEAPVPDIPAAEKDVDTGTITLNEQNEQNEQNETDITPSKRIVLDPGHGGIFSGAEYDGRIEKKLTLKIAEYVKEYLLENYSGIEVYLTREADIELDTDLVTELENRAVFAKEHNADIFVSLHLNASNAHDTSGCTVYYSLRENVSDSGKELAASIKDSLVSLGIKDRGIQTRASNDTFDEDGKPYDYYAVIRHNANRDIPAVIVEHCFIDSSTDIAFIADDNALKRLAKADAEGIMNYMN